MQNRENSSGPRKVRESTCLVLRSSILIKSGALTSTVYPFVEGRWMLGGICSLPGTCVLREHALCVATSSKPSRIPFSGSCPQFLKVSLATYGQFNANGVADANTL